MHRLHHFAFTFVAALLLAGALSVSSVTSARANAADSVTGCLQKGDKPDTYKLVSKDGKSWDVWSKKVSLAGHVGHTVTLTGDVTKGGMSGMKDTSMSKMGMGDTSKMSRMSMSSGSMDVTAMSMVSPSCS
ncbi:MAG: hypothetical protein M3Y05_11695 [Gemmatimonadota bacterium]|nr:hypothetical protein [Gemmatimonadota bacterium]